MGIINEKMGVPEGILDASNKLWHEFLSAYDEDDDNIIRKSLELSRRDEENGKGTNPYVLTNILNTEISFSDFKTDVCCLISITEYDEIDKPIFTSASMGTRSEMIRVGKKVKSRSLTEDILFTINIAIPNNYPTDQWHNINSLIFFMLHFNVFIFYYF